MNKATLWGAQLSKLMKRWSCWWTRHITYWGHCKMVKITTNKLTRVYFWNLVTASQLLSPVSAGSYLCDRCSLTALSKPPWAPQPHLPPALSFPGGIDHILNRRLWATNTEIISICLFSLQIVSAVQYCHQKHIVHRDLKVGCENCDWLSAVTEASAQEGSACLRGDASPCGADSGKCRQQPGSLDLKSIIIVQYWHSFWWYLLNGNPRRTWCEHNMLHAFELKV